ncbi:unnamed protein product [Ectocarpus fasciculatus]
MIEPVTMIVDTPAWGVTAGVMNPSGGHEQEQQRLRGCWLQAAAKHANITAKITNGGFVASLDSPGGLIRGLKQQGPPFLPLHVAASQGMTDAGRVVLERARSHKSSQLNDMVNVPDATLGCTPLHWAAMTNRVDFMVLLLDHGADVDSRDFAGRTPLFSCAAFGGVEAAALLLERNADENAKDSRGQTPLHAAAAGGHLEVADELISAGADVRRQAFVGSMPRHVAEREGHASMVELLVNAARSLEADVDPSDAHGGGPANWLIPELRASIVGCPLASPSVQQQQQQQQQQQLSAA